MDLSRLKQINEDNKNKSSVELKHQQLLEGQVAVQNTVLSATESLIRYMEGHTTKSNIVNQLKSINTPDALKVIPVVESLHETLKNLHNTDLAEVTSVMKGILEEAKKLPKELPKTEKQQFVDYTGQFASLTSAIKAVEKVVKAQELIAETPIVNIPAPNVNVDAPDLTPLQSSMQDVVKAVNGIVIPEYKTDNKKVEDLLVKSNKLLKGLLDKPISSGGGGGGGRATPYQDSNGIPAFVTLVAGKVPVDATVTATVDTTGLATSTLQTSGSQKTQIVDAGGEVATVTGGKLDVNATASLAGDAIPATGATTAVTVQIADGSGNQITSFGGGTQYADGAVRGTATGTIAMVDDGTNIQSLSGDSTGKLNVNNISGTVSLPTGAATATKQDTGNTSIASIDTKTPALGQALAAASVPVILPSATITTLTPPAAITGFATSAKQDTGNTSVASIDTKTPALGQALAASSVPVVLTASQLSTLTPPAQGLTDTQLRATAVPVSLASVPSHAVTNAGTFAVQATPVTQVDTFMLGGVNVKEINGVTPLMGSGIMGTGSPRVTIASDNDALTVKQGTAANLNATVVGTGTFVTQATLAAETTKVIGTVNQGTSPWVTSNATTSIVGNGAAATAQRVTLANDSTGIISLTTGTASIGKLAANSGVIIGDVNVVSNLLPVPVATSTYSPTAFQNLGANATLNVKASAGNVFSLYCNNENAAERFIQLHNTATTPGAAAVPLYTFRVPAGGDVLIGTDFFTVAGANFSTGIAFGFSTTKDTYTAGTAGDHSTLVMYK